MFFGVKELLGILSVGVVIKIYPCVPCVFTEWDTKKNEDQEGALTHTLSEAMLELNLSWCDWEASLSGVDPLNRVCILKDSVSGTWHCQGQVS